ncbi:thioredoxin-like oxidoreductase [Gracilibacillus boraciitolerans JCM 21714]|uniref:Thioredoxin-like oxidoreductase n=1 Tax=Gracilibacillus boraciitolerans JCM 21714 TaxID=1298598 RepID=W4VQ47_9BACI|nr:radical SAM protein [Gracilibacillus boraciitolerans]GAE94948.1 thioredoxin-like oxidoreductase [Gracilibacillus boraciitolerans JCM 21714]
MTFVEEAKRLITPEFDPWEAYMDVEQYGEMTLTNIEFTTTHLCNMRCAHCAVGYTLSDKDPDALPFDLLKKRLDEIPHLRTLSITGGEPMMSKKSVREYVVPLLRYAHERGVRTQINSNLTLPYSRYQAIVPYLDVLHISIIGGERKRSLQLQVLRIWNENQVRKIARNTFQEWWTIHKDWR